MAKKNGKGLTITVPAELVERYKRVTKTLAGVREYSNAQQNAVSDYEDVTSDVMEILKEASTGNG